MKIKIDNIEYKVNMILPKDLENEISVKYAGDFWIDIAREQEIREKRELRLKKINEINAKFK